jgi:hypothetical protein
MNFALGDLVKLKLLEQDEHCYYITAIEDDEDISYDKIVEMILLFPTAKHEEEDYELEYVDEKELVLIAKHGTKDFNVIINAVKSNRHYMKLSNPLPEYVEETEKYLKSIADKEMRENGYRLIETDKTLGEMFDMVDRSVYTDKTEMHNQNLMNTDVDIYKDILMSNHGEEQMKEYLHRMDTHLGLLNKAINENDSKAIKFNKDSLKKVRAKLVELEYFIL